jgi:hypothetical protein
MGKWHDSIFKKLFLILVITKFNLFQINKSKQTT